MKKLNAFEVWVASVAATAVVTGLSAHEVARKVRPRKVVKAKGAVRS